MSLIQEWLSANYPNMALPDATRAFLLEQVGSSYSYLTIPELWSVYFDQQGILTGAALPERFNAWFDVNNADLSLRHPLLAAGVGGGGVYSLLGLWQQPADTTVYLWRNYDSAWESYEMWGPSDNSGHYTCARFGSFTGDIGATIPTIGRLREGIIGTTIHHSSGSVTKTGTWTNSANTATFGGGSSWSSTAGDTIACSVVGSVLGLRVFRTTNGGYATVAIDGDYTAADKLPAVTQALIDAGKFQQAQLGHRYISMYAATSSRDLSDGHIVFTESATNAAHTITIRAAGSAPSGTGNRAYVAAFVGCTGTQAPGDSGTAMFYVRDLTNCGSNSVSAMTLAWGVKPAGATNSVFVGDNHNYETLTSGVWAVDGSPVSLSLNQIVSGDEVTYSRVVDMTHPEAVGSIATKTDVFSCRADRRYQVQYDWSVEWAQAGGLGPAYCGMLNAFAGIGSGGVVGKDFFNACVVGGAEFANLTGGSANVGRSEETVMAFLDPSHDTIASITVPDPQQSLNNWLYSYVQAAYILDGSGNRKAYFTRALENLPGPEPISVSQVMSGSCAWRVFRLNDAYNRIASEFA